MVHILFVCTANQFRSPLAAALFQSQLEQNNDAALADASSAGTWAVDGQPAPEVTLSAGRKLGLHGLADHRTRLINAEVLGQTDLILVMESNQREAILSEFPSAAAHVFLLTEICLGRCYDIPDPVKSTVSTDEIASEIAAYIQIGYANILSKAQELSLRKNGNA